MKIKDKHLREILTKMCSCAGADIDKINFKGNWFQQHTWTQEQEREFKQWLIAYLKKAGNRRAVMEHPVNNKAVISKFVDMFCFQYGWKYK